jgi:hypothetical protein
MQRGNFAWPAAPTIFFVSRSAVADFDIATESTRVKGIASRHFGHGSRASGRALISGATAWA